MDPVPDGEGGSGMMGRSRGSSDRFGRSVTVEGGGGGEGEVPVFAGSSGRRWKWWVTPVS